MAPFNSLKTITDEGFDSDKSRSVELDDAGFDSVMLLLLSLGVTTSLTKDIVCQCGQLLEKTASRPAPDLLVSSPFFN